MRRLLVASKNAHKLDEIRAILGTEWEVIGLDDRPDIPAPEETGETFADNAKLKALALSAQVMEIVLADDSGLEVDALGGAPGVRSARYSGMHATDASNRQLLQQELKDKPPLGGPWPARFRCAMALSRGLEVLGIFEGKVEGAIIAEELGNGGFGYDSLFVPTGHHETFGQLPPAVKNSLSHRARALQQAVGFLLTLETP